MNELSNLQMFVRVVDEGSFSAAARSLGVTPSAVSRQVSQLEEDLGARLFQRTTRKQSLTETGELYFQYAHRILADLEEARLAVNNLTESPSGTLSVTAEADFAVAFIAPVLPAFMDRYPGVRVRLLMTSDKLNLVDQGIDVAIRMSHLEDTSLIARKISESRSLLCASPAYLALHGRPKHPNDLVEHCCLSFRTRPGRNFWRFNVGQETIEVATTGRVNTNSLTFLVAMANAGKGIIMIPKWMAGDALKNGCLVQILEEFPLVPPSTPIHAVFSHRRHIAPKVRAFIDFLAEQVEKSSR